MDNREKIIERAAELFRTYGIRTVTMDILANELGMSKRTIYEIFSDKDELFIGVLKWMSEKQKELVKKVLDESENTIVAIFRLLEINREHVQRMSPAFREDMRKFHRDVLMKRPDVCEMPDYRNNMPVIKKGIAEKNFRDDIDPDIVTRCIDSLARSIMNNDVYPFDQFSRRDVISNVLINYLRGIATPAGLELINNLEKAFIKDTSKYGLL
jgi:AcrR family transcriptional regulator